MKGNGHGRHREETTMRTWDESVMCAQDQGYENDRGNDWYAKDAIWLLASGSTSRVTTDTSIFNKTDNEERKITLSDKKRKKTKIK